MKRDYHTLCDVYMVYPYDLQIHTCRSDGDYPLDTVLELAKTIGLKGLSITDHNLAVGVNAAAERAREKGFTAIAGVEISAKFQGVETHILGYSRQFNESILAAGLRQTLEGYDERSRKMVELVNRSGMAKLDFERMKKAKGEETCIVKYDIAYYLGPLIGQSRKDAQKLFDRGGPFFVPYGDWAMSPVQAVDLIHRSGGRAVLAHPGETAQKMGEPVFSDLLSTLLPGGLDGMEVTACKHTLEQNNRFAEYARKHQLLMTGGSDYHGDQHHPEIEMGAGGLTEEQFREFYAALV
ncbi:PHP domain-containing protein [Patescibacteria group bacterium]|nr:PHP domain-containing protein [Patescibacteria group bacterium]